MTLAAALAVPATSDPAELARHLDEAGPSARLAEVRALGRRDLARLWELAAGAAVDLDHFVPPEVVPGEPVRHLGTNSLLAFRTFEKRFLRPVDGRERLHGYNHQAMQVLTGPGYFVVDPAANCDELFIDYYEVPPSRPRPDWPAVRDNEHLPGKLVYGRMRDRMRRVSTHVSIGRAYREGKAMDAWFAMVREPLGEEVGT